LLWHAKTATIRLHMNKRNTVVLCFIGDLWFAIYSYLAFKDYDQFTKLTSPVLKDPAMQAEMFDLLMQGLIISLILFLFLHVIVFLYYVNGSKFATKYLRFYTALTMLSCLLMVFTGIYSAILPLLIYGYCFVSTRKV
jgi:hypothetical protein